MILFLSGAAVGVVLGAVGLFKFLVYGRYHFGSSRRLYERGER